ncbi:hypothetical protein [Plesiomonas shigelloides]
MWKDFTLEVKVAHVQEVLSYIASQPSFSVITRRASKDILKWAFSARISRPFQTTAHAGVLRYAPLTKYYQEIGLISTCEELASRDIAVVGYYGKYKILFF